MDCSTQGIHVHHQLPEFTQTHVHWVGDTIQPSYPLSTASHPVFNLSQHQGLFKWASFSHQVAKVLEFQLQHQSFQWIFRTDFLENRLVESPCSPRDSQESPATPQFKSISSSALSFLYSPTLIYMTTRKTIALTRQTFVSKVMSLLFSMLSRLVITFLPLVIQFSSVALCDSLWPHESQHEMQIQNYNSYHPTQVRMAIITKSTNNKCWRRCGAKGTLLHYWWECKLIQPLWRTA